MSTSLFGGDPENPPCCCTEGCCPGYVLPDCLTMELSSSCCPGEVASVVLTSEFAGTCEGGVARPFTAAEAFCGGTPDIIYSGALDSGWCVANELFDATVLVFCCVNPETGDSEWWMYISDGDGSHYWYPATDAKYYRLDLVSCDPLLLQIGGDPPDCSGEECVWTWQAVCFVDGTLIRTPYGEVLIEDLKVGDVLLDIHNQEVYVLEIIPSEVDYLIQITDERGVDTGVTPEHPFMEGDMVSTIEARHLEVGKRLPFGKEVTGITLFKATKEKFKVKNLHVSGSNTFFADGFAVHNKGIS